jgi:hypothetical protein
MTPPPSARSSGVVVAICSAADACQHAVGQDVVGPDERGEVGDAQPPRPCPCPGSAAGGCRPRSVGQRERPRPREVDQAAQSRPPGGGHETVGVQHQQLRRVDLLHHETRRRRVGRRGCHHLPPAAVVGREPAGWRWASLAEQQPVDPLGGVETAAVPAHLTLGEFAVGPGNLRSRGNLVRHRGRRRVRALADGGGEVPFGEDADQMLAPKTGKVPTWCQFMRSAASSRPSSAWAVNSSYCCRSETLLVPPFLVAWYRSRVPSTRISRAAGLPAAAVRSGGPPSRGRPDTSRR